VRLPRPFFVSLVFPCPFFTLFFISPEAALTPLALETYNQTTLTRSIPGAKQEIAWRPAEKYA
jgi:hypothetical protein